MQIMRAQAGLHGAKRSVAHNFEHYVPLPTTDPGWAGRTRPLPKPQTIGGGTNSPGANLDARSAPEGGAPGTARIKEQRRAGARQAGRQPSLPVPPRKRQRREPRPAEAAEPVAQQPAVLNSGTAQPAAEPQALGPVFRGEGRRGVARAVTEGQSSKEGELEPFVQWTKEVRRTSQSAGACGGSLAAPTLAQRSPARRLPAKHASGVTDGPDRISRRDRA